MGGGARAGVRVRLVSDWRRAHTHPAAGARGLLCAVDAGRYLHAAADLFAVLVVERAVLAVITRMRASATLQHYNITFAFVFVVHVGSGIAWYTQHHGGVTEHCIPGVCAGQP